MFAFAFAFAVSHATVSPAATVKVQPQTVTPTVIVARWECTSPRPLQSDATATVKDCRTVAE